MNRLVRDGVLAKDPGGYPFDKNVRSYLAHVVEIERRKASGSAAGRALADRKAELIRHRMERDDASLIALAEAVDVFDELVELFANSFDRMERLIEADARQAASLRDGRRAFVAAAAEKRTVLASGKDSDG